MVRKCVEFGPYFVMFILSFFQFVINVMFIFLVSWKLVR